MGDVILRLSADTELAFTRKRDLVSSLRRVSAALSAPVEEIPADPAWLQQRLRGLAPASLGLSKKSWSNITSDVKAALTHAGVVAKRFKDNVLGPPWQTLWDRVDDLHLRCNPTRFVTYCSRTGIQPSNVTDDTVSDFMGLFSSLRKDPELGHYLVTKCWNRAAITVAGWPRVQLRVPSRRNVYRALPEDLPHTFRDDVERYLALMGGQDLLAEDAPPKPLRPASIVQYRKQLYRFCGELLAAGVPAERIISLRELVRPERVDTGLRQMIGRNGERTSQNIFMTAYMLKNIATHYCKLEQQSLKKLEAMCVKLRVPYRGMTPKNRQRLRQFDDPVNVGRVLHLSERLVAEAETEATPTKQAARLVEMALAIELLLMAALRIRNLAALHLNRNIQWQRATRERCCHLVLEPHEVKNEEHIEFELPPTTSSLLSLFLERYRPLLVPPQSPWLFSRRDKPEPISRVVLASRIKCIVRDRTGLEVNPHLFRSLGGKIYLDQNPGGYEVVRRMLGHKSLSTTLRAYTGAETKSAAKHFDETLRKLRDGPRPPRASWQESRRTRRRS